MEGELEAHEVQTNGMDLLLIVTVVGIYNERNNVFEQTDVWDLDAVLWRPDAVSLGEKKVGSSCQQLLGKKAEWGGWRGLLHFMNEVLVVPP